MPVYHSALNGFRTQEVCGASILPLKTLTKGPAPPCREDEVDIIDEAINFFRANVLFRQFTCEGPADRVLCYLTVYIGEVLRVLQKIKDKKEAIKQPAMLAAAQFSVPGDGNFSLGGFFSKPANKGEADTVRAYFKQLREECAKRLIERVYNADGTQHKFWLSFHKKKFMNITNA